MSKETTKRVTAITNLVTKAAHSGAAFVESIVNSKSGNELIASAVELADAVVVSANATQEVGLKAVGIKADFLQQVCNVQPSIILSHRHHKRQLDDLVEKGPEFPFVILGPLTELGFEPLHYNLVVDRQHKYAVGYAKDVF